MKYQSVYISGPLTNVDPALGLRELYEKLGAFLESQGIHAHVPHLTGDPLLFPTLTPKEIWDMDARAVRAADCTIAYVGIPALGVGQELEIAREARKDIVLWNFVGEKVTRMTLGNPAVVARFEVASFTDLCDALSVFLVH